MALTGASAFAANAAPAAEPSDRDPEARAILLKMADCIAKAPGFSVTIRSGYDAIQEDGQRIEFGERRKILLQRPDRVRVEVERSDGERGLILFDGKELTAFKAEGNVYARVEKPGTVDDAVVYLVRDLQMTLPLARMLRKDFPQNLDQLITSLSYVEKNALFDVATDHLAARSADVDMQVWIANGQQPLPRRIILTYRNEPGHPQFRADLSDWNLSPKIAAGSFSFTPPLGAERIPFLAPLAQKGSLPMPKGGQK
ncbi:MAG: DUF2092 domain-containing protein [Deltaproteobacteria bacterium]|nr:DUF2092 domain-containing protein [Deltaproteobacteria bacterium]